jgi:CRP-like cAMP-binding protein
MKKILKDKSEETNLNKILYYCSFYLNYTFLKKETFLFRRGEPGDKFFIILEGSVNVLEYKAKEQSFNGERYLFHLMDLRRNGQIDILSKTIETNQMIFPVNEEDFKIFKIEGLYLRYKIRTLIRQNLDKRSLRFQINSFTKGLGLDEYLYDISDLEEKVLDLKLLKRSNQTMEDEEKKQFLKKNSSGINLNLYNYIDIKDERTVQMFEYNVFLTLYKGQYFGDYALDNSDGLR